MKYEDAISKAANCVLQHKNLMPVYPVSISMLAGFIADLYGKPPRKVLEDMKCSEKVQAGLQKGGQS